MRKRAVAIIVNAAALQYVSCANDHGGAGLGREFNGFAQTMRDLLPFGNRRFFRELAKRQDPKSLLRVIVELVQSPDDRELIRREALAAYSAGNPSVHPTLLAFVLEEIK